LVVNKKVRKFKLTYRFIVKTSMSHDHHHHHATPTNLTKAFLIGITLNIVFVIIEASAGFYINSLSLLSDAGHILSDVFSLILALAAIKIANASLTISTLMVIPNLRPWSLYLMLF